MLPHACCPGRQCCCLHFSVAAARPKAAAAVWQAQLAAILSLRIPYLEFTGVHAIVALDKGVAKVVDRELHQLLQRFIIQVLVERIAQVVTGPVPQLSGVGTQDSSDCILTLLAAHMQAGLSSQRNHGTAAGRTMPTAMRCRSGCLLSNVYCEKRADAGAGLSSRVRHGPVLPICLRAATCNVYTASSRTSRAWDRVLLGCGS